MEQVDLTIEAPELTQDQQSQLDAVMKHHIAMRTAMNSCMALAGEAEQSIGAFLCKTFPPEVAVMIQTVNFNPNTDEKATLVMQEPKQQAEIRARMATAKAQSAGASPLVAGLIANATNGEIAPEAA